jgi:Protein kinase domain
VAEARTLRDGRFVLLQPIGEGAQGRTYEAVDKREGRVVAIKRFDVRGATSWKDVELAEREARVLQSLSHPKLPAYIDHFEEDGALYLVMDKVEGESLVAYRKRVGAMGEEEIWRLLRDASAVLDYLHGRVPPVIHRDLKPGNVIRRPDGSFAFVDFGAVRDKLRPRGGSTVVGTFGYMAPEQVQGRALPASDVYAIGATALALLTGSEPEDLPHRGLSIDVRQALRDRASSRVRPDDDRREREMGTPRLADVLARMLDPDPDRRASRIAPLLSQAPPRTYHDSWDPRYSERVARRAERRARHAARRLERAARRQSRWQNAHDWQERRRHPFPWPARLFFAIGFTLGIVAVFLATKRLVPFVLLVLSAFFARRPLSAAARAVSRAGDTALAGMMASRRWFLRGDSAEGEETPASAAGRDAGGSGRGKGSEEDHDHDHYEERQRIENQERIGDRQRIEEPERLDKSEEGDQDEEWDSAGESARRRSGR